MSGQLVLKWILFVVVDQASVETEREPGNEHESGHETNHPLRGCWLVIPENAIEHPEDALGNLVQDRHDQCRQQNHTKQIEEVQCVFILHEVFLSLAADEKVAEARGSSLSLWRSNFHEVIL